ncbi:pancreatic lipase-related protein 2-like [Euwallacea fornicatus]|uniref:pancreatic lipase-related protein 2-like n=1 Tax=Euwallacea fornicatus TaxID=995702 RepID=UPI0033901B4E
MKLLLVFCAFISIGSTKSATLLKPSELTIDLINDSRFLVWETEEGLYEVEDLENTNDSNIILFATEDDISFYVFTPENPHIGVQIRESDLHRIVALTGFNVNRPTLVVIHGWKGSYKSAINDNIKTAALKKHNINVLVVDWSSIASKNYVIAQKSVLAVGNYIGDILLQLDDKLNYTIKHITIVGHSLGAHISGNIGARTNGLIETIIGLDPAGPLFISSITENRLDPTDGKFVHVIHTNDGTLGYGLKMGHADFYPNGGSSQPGCGLDLIGSCSHRRAYEYFTESLESNHFIGTNCTSYRDYNRNRCDENVTCYMGGYPIEKKDEGEYFLKTNRAPPFAQG